MISQDGSGPSGVWEWVSRSIGSLLTWKRPQACSEAEVDLESSARAAASAAPWRWDIASSKLQWKSPLDQWLDAKVLSTGGDPAGLLGLVRPIDRDRVRGAVDYALENSEGFEVTCRLNGREGVLRVTGSPQHHDDGTVSGLAGLVQKTTDDPRASAAPVRQAKLLAQVHDAVISTDLEGRIETWNAGAQRVYGYTAEQVEGKHIGMLYFTEEEERLEQQMTAAVLASGTHEFVGRFRHHSGVPLYADVRLAVFRDSDDTPAGIVSCSHDVTRQREEQEAFQLQARVLESMAEGVCLTDRSGVILFTNPAWDSMYGAERRGLLGKRMERLLSHGSGADGSPWTTAVDELNRTGKWTGELEVLRGNETSFTALAQVSQLVLIDTPCWVWVQQEIAPKAAEKAGAS